MISKRYEKIVLSLILAQSLILGLVACIGLVLLSIGFIMFFPVVIMGFLFTLPFLYVLAVLAGYCIIRLITGSKFYNQRKNRVLTTANTIVKIVANVFLISAVVVLVIGFILFLLAQIDTKTLNIESMVAVAVLLFECIILLYFNNRREKELL